MVGSPSTSQWSTTYSTVLSTTGSYSVVDLPVGSNYWVFAFIDSNGNMSNDLWEVQAVYSNNPVRLTSDLFNIDIVMDAPDTDADSLADWWEMDNFGDLDDPESEVSWLFAGQTSPRDI